MAATVTWDQRNFDRAMREAHRFTRRTPAEAVNTAAFHVVLFWIDEMDKVPISRIDAELAAQFSPGRLKSGKLSKAKKHARDVVSVSVGGAGRSKTVPLAVLIIQARSNPNSKYSRITNRRFLAPSPYKGVVSREVGNLQMKAAVSRMIKARHRSSAFLASSMLPAADDLRPYVKRGSRGSAPPIDRRRVVRYGAEKGGALPALEAMPVARTVIFSNVGMFGVQARGQFAAIWNHGGPAMQRAIDKEAYYQMLFVVREAQKEFDRRTRAFR